MLVLECALASWFERQDPSAAALQMMGGRFRSVMPSNLIYPGACAIESLPAPGSEYASQAAKGELRRLFARCSKVLLKASALALEATPS